jgi:SAM-dependent methyltransferase
VWGVDDWQDLPYFPPEGTWIEQYQREVVQKCGKAKLVRGLLGRPESPAASVLPPDGSFDLVCSVSVLEEAPLVDAVPVLPHAYRLLRPGGALVNSNDLCLGTRGGRTPLELMQEYVGAHRHVGFSLEFPEIDIDMGRLLLENPTTAMLHYQHDEGENRRFWGQWTTVISVAKK